MNLYLIYARVSGSYGKKEKQILYVNSKINEYYDSNVELKRFISHIQLFANEEIRFRLINQVESSL